MDETTQTSRSLTDQRGGPAATDAAALVLIWSRDEPGRAGEVLVVPDEPGSTWTFGRGGAGPGGRSRSLGLVRQRPGVAHDTGALACPRISREQLELSVEPTGALVVTNVGRCALVLREREVTRAAPVLREREVTRAELLPGDVIELRNEMAFLCARRPRALAAWPADAKTPLHAFGEADAFGLVGESPAIWSLRGAVGALARRPVHVLVLGPSGSGKELVAHAIHAQSARSERPFVARNASTIPEGLVDAELFGHTKSFPNPGTPERPGLVGEADGGTLFLDELAELPAGLQAHLLRVLDGGEYHRLGEARARRADLRLVGATNRSEQSLKHDVLARFKGRLLVPGLDARREDIPLLVAHLLRRQAISEPALLDRFFGRSDPKATPRVAPDLMTALVQHRYRAHVREIDTLLICASIECRGKYLDITPGVTRLLEATFEPPDSLLPADRTPSAATPGVANTPSSPASTTTDVFTEEEQRRLAIQRKHGFSAVESARDAQYGASRQAADLHLRQMMSRALAMSGWDIDDAATLLGGDDAGHRSKARRRLETFLFNLEKRMAEEGAAALHHALAGEWRASAPSASRLIEALERGWLRGRRPGG